MGVIREAGLSGINRFSTRLSKRNITGNPPLTERLTDEKFERHRRICTKFLEQPVSLYFQFLIHAEDVKNDNDRRPDSEIRRLPACKIWRFMVVWRHKKRESRRKD